MLESSFFAVYLPMVGGYHQISDLSSHFDSVKMAKDGSLDVGESIQDGYEIVDGRQVPTIVECVDRLYTFRENEIQFYCMSNKSDNYTNRVNADTCDKCKVCRGRGSNA